MHCLTPRFVRRALIPASHFIFLAGIGFSSAIFYRGKPFHIKPATVSVLMSPLHNPQGYGIAIAATALTALLLIRTVLFSYQRLRRKGPKLALIGAVMSAFGLTALLAIAALSPFTRIDSWPHIILAHTALIGICAGIFCHLVAARATLLPLLAHCGFLVVLFYLYVAWRFFANHTLLTSLTSLECVFCLDCAVGFWALAKLLERHWKEAKVEVSKRP